MVLSSQQARSGANRSYLSSRRRGGRGKRLFIIALIVVGVGLLIWWAMRGGGESTDSDPGSTAPGSNNSNVQANANTDGPGAANTNNNTGNTNTSQFAPAPGSTGNTGSTDNTTAHRPPTPPAPPAGNNGGTTPPPPAGNNNDNISKGDTPPPSGNTSAAVAKRIAEGRALVQQQKLVEGRAMLNSALAGPISRTDSRAVKQELSSINDKLIFSPLVAQGDPYVSTVVVQPGEMLSQIAPKFNIPYQLIMRVNNIKDARRVPAHARLKVVKGPFHIVVNKSTFTLDVYLTGEDGGDLFVRSFPVGLGEYGSTPTGAFIVQRHKKQVNPPWTNLRTNQHFAADDPRNPIGERWIGLRGTDSETELMRGYGIHGTIEPQSIGTEASMGCVRMLPDNVALVYDMVCEEKTKVIIRP